MEGVLPDEFPFNKRRETPPDPTPPPQPVQTEPERAPEPAPTPVVTAPPAQPPTAHIERQQAEALVEVTSTGHVVYRGPERRRSPRQALRAKAVYRDDTKPATGGPVQVVNISMFGVRLWSTRAMTVGDKGGVRMELGPVKWSSKVRVVSCTALDDDGYVIGCEFVAKEVERRRVDAA